MNPNDIAALSDKIKEEVGKVIIGQDEIVEFLLIALFSKGHVLLEGVPGTAKTLLAQTFSQGVSLNFKRIQFTPDLMPGDILGTNIFNFEKNEFTLLKGPIFTDILLADEINRTPPKTQAALLQAMQEREVTIDNVTFRLGDGFTVIATQNPIEQQGTYPLPEAQLDRFLFKLILGHPTRAEEIEIVSRHGKSGGMPDVSGWGLQKLLDLPKITAVRQMVENVILKQEIVEYIVDIMRETREFATLQFGASTRSANMLASAARALALISGRDYVIPDDIKTLYLPVLRHRIVLSPSAEIEGMVADQVLEQILNQIPVPN